RRGIHGADSRLAALACAPPRRGLPARILHLASRQLACPDAIRGGVLDAWRGGACRRTRMRHLRLQVERARRGPAAPIHGSSAALRPALPGTAPVAAGVSDRDRPSLLVGTRPGPREWLPRAVRVPIRAVLDRRRGRPRARASAAPRGRRLAALKPPPKGQPAPRHA